MKKPSRFNRNVYATMAAVYGGPGMFYLLIGEWIGAAIGLSIGITTLWIGDCL